MKGVSIALCLFAALAFIDANAQDKVKQALLGKKWFLQQVISDNERVDVPDANKKHYMLFTSKTVETIGPNGEILESPYTINEQTHVVTITNGNQKMKIISVNAKEMIFYFLADPDKIKYVTKPKTGKSQ